MSITSETIIKAIKNLGDKEYLKRLNLFMKMMWEGGLRVIGEKSHHDSLSKMFLDY